MNRKKKNRTGGFAARHRRSARAIAPALPIAASAFILALSFSFATPLFYRPVLVMIPIYYFSITKNPHISFISIMTFAFVQDFMDGTAFGANMFLFLVLHFAAYYQKIFPLGENPLLAFGTFACASGILTLAKGAILAVISPSKTGGAAALYSWLWLCAFYPPTAWALAKIHKPTASAEEK
ncbi:MAG: hypothetical protein LBH41_02225 [Rickettsiales bacterium]|jgi:hypothetical protein|nr:hypothetical protein [Rickettsiales bacterium]